MCCRCCFVVGVCALGGLRGREGGIFFGCYVGVLNLFLFLYLLGGG